MSSAAASPCPICDGGDHRSLFRVGDFDIRRCASCDHAWAAGDAAHDYVRQPSLLDYYRDDETQQRRLARRSLRQLRRWLPAGSRVLDFGCGPGLFVAEARAAGIDAVGIDLADWVREAAEHWKVPLHVGPLEDAPYEAASFDAVVSIVCHEHLAEPAAITRQLARLVKPGGVLAVVSVPSSRGLAFRLNRERWWDLAPPGHVQYFSPRSLRRLLADAGLDVVRVRTTGVGRDFFSALLRRKPEQRSALDAFQLETNTGPAPLSQGPVRWLASRVAIPLANALLDVTRLGNNLTVVARKPRREG